MMRQLVAKHCEDVSGFVLRQVMETISKKTSEPPYPDLLQSYLTVRRVIPLSTSGWQWPRFPSYKDILNPPG